MKTTFEDYLQEQFILEERPLDDLIPDMFNDWLCSLDNEELIEYAEKWGKYVLTEELGDVWLCRNCRKQNSEILNKYNLF